jgi:hypothetical protein
MNTPTLLNCGNYYNENSFNELCDLLEQGKAVNVYIDCIGHNRNNNEQEAYKESLVDKYGDMLTVEINKGAFSYSYIYSLQVTVK